MERILVIEDNLEISKLISNALELDEFSVTICTDCRSLENKLKNENCFAAIIDMELPDSAWEKAADLVRNRNIPAIAYLSGKYSKELKEKLLAKDILDYIFKDSVQSLEILIMAIDRLRKNSKIKLLIVDDSSSARKVGRYILEKAKFQIFEAFDGFDALRVLEEHPDINLVITDYEMPNLNGYGLVEKIREQFDNNTISIIGVSHPSTDASPADFLKYGANDFISKPYTNEEFYCRVITQAELLESFGEIKLLNNQKNFIMSMVAHDIRGPIGSIQMVCNRLLVKSRDEYSDKVEKALGAISGSSEKMMNLMNDLLNIRSIESGKNELDITLNSLQNLVESRLKSSFYSIGEKKRIAMSFKYDNIPETQFDLNRITQVVDNLISNALKFTPYDGEIEIYIKQKKDRTLFRICDTGPGLTSDDKVKVFKEFQKLSAKPTGGETSTGLGLAICKKIITLHGGQIGVESEPGLGAEFYFSIPLKID